MINFTVDEHKYTDVEGNYYTSVTTLIKKYKTFDKEAVARNYAIKHPEKSAKQWIETWEAIGKESAEYGTKVHKEEEDKVRCEPNCKDGSYQIDGNSIRSLDTLLDLEDGLYPELLIWSNEFKLAGQVDLVKLTDGVVDITDYKTYKKVDLKSFYNPKKGGWTVMKEPLQGLHDCNYNHAGLQLSMYALLLEKLGYKIGTLTMVHINRDGVKIPYNVPYSKFKMFVNFMLFNHMKK